MKKSRDKYLNAIVAVGIPQELLQTRAVQQLANEKLTGAVLRDTNTLHRTLNEIHMAVIKAVTDLLDDVGAKLLNGERADVTRKLPDDGIAETIVVKVQDVLDNLHPVHVSKEYSLSLR